MNTCVFENEISLGSDKTSHGIPAIDDVNATLPECAVLGLTSTNYSSKKTKTSDDIPTSIENKKLYEWAIEEFSEPIYSER